jgi:hypothetical protein
MKIPAFFAALLGFACMAQAHTHVYQATLSGANEDVPNNSAGIGTSTVTLDLDLITMLLEIDFSGLAGSSSAAFIQAPTSIPLTGTAAPMTPSLSDSGFPLGVTDGSYSHLFDLTDAPGYDPSFITASGGTVSNALNALIFSFDDGTAYLNIRSSTFPNGEIRGFYAEVQEVPEPASLTMIGFGCCILTQFRRRR